MVPKWTVGLALSGVQTSEALPLELKGFLRIKTAI
jgi:hypothetical protein